jgi:multiple sugar transport system substrate-binding protein
MVRRHRRAAAGGGGAAGQAGHGWAAEAGRFGPSDAHAHRGTSSKAGRRERSRAAAGSGKEASMSREHSGGGGRQVTRRAFLRTGAAAAAGLAGILAWRRGPAFAQQRELKILTWAHFVPASDEELKRQAEEWGKANRVRVRVDLVAHLQLPAKKAAEVQAQSGHDMLHLYIDDPDLYFDHLVTVDDVASELSRQAGGFFDEELFRYRGRHFKAIPWYYISFPIAYRMDVLEQLGETVPDTWEDMLRVGKKAKAAGHPVGIQISHCFDSNAILRGLLWSYGAAITDKDAKTITLHSPQTAQAIEFMKALFQEAMEQEVLSWDDANNNRCLNGGKCAMILNPISAYESARDAKALIPGTDRQIHEVINHALPPKGPAGRHMSASYNMFGIWSFSKQIDAAKDFLRYHFAAEQQNRFIEASRGYNQPLLRRFADHPIWSTNPKYAFAPKIGEFTHPPSWPAPPHAASQVTMNLYVIPDMFANAVTGKMTTAEAMAWAEKELKDIYEGRKKG